MDFERAGIGPLRRLATRAVWWTALLAGRITRPMTLGVRVAVYDAEGRIFLVRHTYVPGYHMPGGGVDRGESAEAAAVRELREEGAIGVGSRPALFGFYFQRSLKWDHVALYVVRDPVLPPAPPPPNREIAACGFFAPDALPEGTTPATRRRLAELAGAVPPASEW
ncbi:NUDIX domain-containing protein [Pseudoxanthobacter sp.]|uniref:NUDIX domain-containing protein n=1 Tax=Pseudoxanthobacter sp. TaxID=1925742 RepID=UPI002FE393C1